MFMMFSNSCFVTSHVALKNSWLIPSLSGAFLAFPVVTAARNSSNVIGSSSMFGAIGGSFLRPQSSVFCVLSAELGMWSYFRLRWPVNVRNMAVDVVWIIPSSFWICVIVRAFFRFGR